MKLIKADPGRFRHLSAEEHDSCGIVAVIEKNGNPTQQNMLDTIDALVKMEHRSGFINGEGDGCGILTDIPRILWAQKFREAGIDSKLAYSPGLIIAHFFLPQKTEEPLHAIQERIRSNIRQRNIQILLEVNKAVHSQVLGPNGRKDEPLFWQVAMKADSENDTLPHRLFELTIDIEASEPVQIASLSNQTVVYKLMGAASLLPRYFQDLSKGEFQSTVTIGHNRYSTNTLSNFFRVQPFSILGHNGEINTIAKLRDEARMIATPLVEGGSDSQDLNRVVETLIHRYNFSLFEAIETLFPTIMEEISRFPQNIQQTITWLRKSFGPFAQGPAGIVSRYGNECAFSVDALGLRPLWQIENQRAFMFSSEQGIISASEMISEPKPLAPGETVGVELTPQAIIIPHHKLQQKVFEGIQQRVTLTPSTTKLSSSPPSANNQLIVPTNQQYAAFGWDREHIKFVEQMADTGSDPIRSLGHDSPLAALAHQRQNLPDFIKESVAVVTNPAIDREREQEHFSTHVYLGHRPTLDGECSGGLLELPSPIVTEGPPGEKIAKSHSTYSYEQLINTFVKLDRSIHLPLHFAEDMLIPDALNALANQAIEAVQEGKSLLIFDDRDCFSKDRLLLPPHLAIAYVDQRLKEKMSSSGESLRRQASILLRTGMLRNLHDLAVAIGLGADALNPYLMFATIAEDEESHEEQLYEGINKGLEKIFSTIGIHELRGYSRLFSSIGLHPEVAGCLGIVNYAGSTQAGYSFEDFVRDAKERRAEFTNDKARPGRSFQLWPRIWKSIVQLAEGSISYADFSEKLGNLEQSDPLSLRHPLDIDQGLLESDTDPSQVDIGVGDHDLPFVISSMSFGSQNEIAFRAYAEAAAQLNMISLNGEGGEIKDMYGRYRKTRGHQIASGRFGIHVELANSADILEIKIGQGAKPGEGGHLPGKKVSTKVAAARNATPGTDLISPSNNHDIYSIEDLAQIITELKTANRMAKVIVKVPIVPNIGTIAVGIAKAGADIITLSGFDGGTGAARIHALQHVGLPAEIGIKAAHVALVEAGIRHQVELWADGGIKSGLDVVKLVLLGADRIGFGTLAMLAIGCTACRGCHLDTCHVGIATQIETEEEAEDHGLRRFVPRVPEQAVAGLKRLFTAFGDEVRRIVAHMGYTRLSDLVGRSDLLQQTRATDQIDLSDFLRPVSVDWQQKRHSEVALLVAAGSEGEIQAPAPHPFSRPGNHSYGNVDATQRVLVADVSGSRVRPYLDGSYIKQPEVHLSFSEGSIPGNGFSSYHADGVMVTVNGGAQDGVGKTALGGRVAILKTPNDQGVYINGSVGKGFCYGAQKGLFIVQGNADSRAGIRLSGADVIIAGEPDEPLKDNDGLMGAQANIKGFAFEYMTNGRGIVLGDPGPWMCAGMTGGVVYLRLIPEVGLDQKALTRRIAKGAKVKLQPLGDTGERDIQELLETYRNVLIDAGQVHASTKIHPLIEHPKEHFMQIIPEKVQADPAISTE
ncbi:glutamate synthase-related protein [Marininema halotolerans]|uniref:Glutamate synthase (NADPH/NADH) large chain n=1 Tax=Marininema halotolerans TaxID=1155944 RepID=A0A1I6UG79_9BACL|nr:glutamate synthase-related protein [Marininema halotolerans]SFT00411.1 glutamate synthase (NADPH/NADH) large chain [Marininema halotolerans]